MSGVFGNPWLYNATPPFYNHLINQSLRFNDNDSAYLSHTPPDAGNRKTWTWSAWVKRSSIGSNQYLFQARIDDSSTEGNKVTFYFLSDNTIRVLNQTTVWKQTSAVFRDTSAWMHIVLTVDTTNATTNNRVRIYINGEEASYSTNAGPSLNADLAVNSTNPHYIGQEHGGYSYFDGYLAEVNFVDGTALTPASFGETKDGVWIPKKYSGSYGNEGFHLTFQGTGTATTSQGTTAQTNIGDDQSGNGNNWAVNALVASDVVPDSPTNNFATLNPLEVSSTNDAVLSDGNLIMTPANGSGWNTRHSTAYMSSGKWYVEYSRVVNSGDVFGGIIQEGSTDANYVGYGANGYGYHVTGVVQKNASNVATGLATYGTDDVIGIALDMDNGTVQWSKNGTLQGSAITGLTGAWGFAVSFTVSGTTLGLNFGQDSSFAGNITSGSAGASDANGVGDFYNAPPSGFLALASSNLPEPSIIDGSKHFNTVLWTGTGSGVTRSISGVGFRPDFSWSKNRTENYSNILYDAVRGTGSEAELQSNDTAKQGDGNNDTYGYLSSFDSDGFTSTAGSGGNSQNLYFNESGKNYVAWNWKAGGATPTKTYKVVVVSDSGNKYRFRNSADDATYAASAVTLELQEGGTYTFDQSDSSNSGHPFRFYTAADKSGGEYTTGVTTSGTAGSAGATVTIILAASAPTLYYQCSAHAGMGGQVNTNSTYGSTNFDGTLIATVSANVEAGFSIARWTGNAVDNTVIPHGLGGAADLVITKSQTIVASPWLALHSNIASETNNVIILNQITAATNGSSTLTYGCPDELTSVGVKLVRGTGSSMNYVNGSGRAYIAYCFKNVDGYLKCGGYTGNGADDGAFVFTGGRPKLLMVRRTTNADNWVIDDSTRSPFNEMNNTLYANIVNSEYTGGLYGIDFLSNGFKIRDNDGNYNASGNNYVYLCIMETPQKYSNAR